VEAHLAARCGHGFCLLDAEEGREEGGEGKKRRKKGFIEAQLTVPSIIDNDY
jgi:hypothetical protein